MCGIVGLFSPGGELPHRDLWPDLVNHLQHRGPDEGAWWADGPFFLGHRRLSIIDIEGGGQPMASGDGRLVVTFNGEIYNYIEVRDELEALGHTFQTHSDTEVLVHGYRQWGVDLPTHLTGMFAFAIADRELDELYLARDRFGEKPLYIARQHGYLMFASELRPITALPDLPRELDIDALGCYLSLNYVPGSATLLQSVRRIAPGSWLLVTATGEREGRYWEPSPQVEIKPTASLDAMMEEWRHHFDNAVRLCLRSDVPVGIFLSGGMDSSLVAESAARQGRLSDAYVIDFEEQSYGEYGAASHVAERLGIPLHRTTLTPDALVDFLQLVEHADDPMADSSSLPVYVLSRFARQGNKVVLGGDGGDELFAGYLTYRASLMFERVFLWLPQVLRTGIARSALMLPTSEGKVTFSYKLRRLLRAVDLTVGQAHLSWNGTWLPKEAGQLVGHEYRHRVQGALARHVQHVGLGSKRPSLSELQVADTQEYLPNDILTKVDRMSMAHGLETRAPFLDWQLAEWALRRHESNRIGAGGELKTVLREAARRTFGPDVGNRPKWGFSIPIHAWIRGPMADMISELLDPKAVDQTGVLDATGVSKVVEDHQLGRRSYGFELWGLAVLMAWYNSRVKARPVAPRGGALVERRFHRTGF